LISSSRIIARASGALLAVLLLGSLGIPGHASARTWPKPQGYVSDFAGVLDAASRDSLEALAAELREKTGAELAVATTPNLGDDDIDAAAVDLFKAWGVGSKSKDEGVLILLAQQERRVRIEVGYGLEGILPDGLCGSIIRHVMAPDLSAERYGPGLLQGARAVVPALWHLEMANGFAVAERRGILTAADTSQSVNDLEQLLAETIESSSDAVSLRQTLTTALAFQLSAYDAVYLDTARREGLPIATLDRRLQAAAGQAGVELFG